MKPTLQTAAAVKTPVSVGAAQNADTWQASGRNGSFAEILQSVADSAMTRRTMLKLLPATAIGRAPDARAGGWLLVMLPIVLQELGAWLRASRDRESAERLAASNVYSSWMEAALASGDLRMAAMARGGALATLGKVATNVDSHGTSLGVNGGQVWVERGNTLEKLTADEVEISAKFAALGASCPVPEAPAYRPVTKAEAPELVEAMANSRHMDPDKFLESNTPIAWRPMRVGRDRLNAVVTAVNQRVGERRVVRTFVA